jgi:RNA polymerase sigma-70 factor, ECF subfamily
MENRVQPIERPGEGDGLSARPVSRGATFPSGLDLSDPVQAGRVFPVVYEELRALAARQIRRERADAMLQPTELVHEAYMRLAGSAGLHWEGRAHFLRLAARAMRQVLIDAARRRNADRRGGAWRRITLDPNVVSESASDFDVLELHEALARLGGLDGALEELVELRFFAGLTLDQAAAALGVSRRKAAKDWAAARLWLRRELTRA